MIDAINRLAAPMIGTLCLSIGIAVGMRISQSERGEIVCVGQVLSSMKNIHFKDIAYGNADKNDLSTAIEDAVCKRKVRSTRLFAIGVSR